jgi:hypothetical protein
MKKSKREKNIYKNSRSSFDHLFGEFLKDFTNQKGFNGFKKLNHGVNNNTVKMKTCRFSSFLYCFFFHLHFLM